MAVGQEELTSGGGGLQDYVRAQVEGAAVQAHGEYSGGGIVFGAGIEGEILTDGKPIEGEPACVVGYYATQGVAGPVAPHQVARRGSNHLATDGGFAVRRDHLAMQGAEPSEGAERVQFSRKALAVRLGL